MPLVSPALGKCFVPLPLLSRHPPPRFLCVWPVAVLVSQSGSDDQYEEDDIAEKPAAPAAGAGAGAAARGPSSALVVPGAWGVGSVGVRAPRPVPPHSSPPASLPLGLVCICTLPVHTVSTGGGGESLEGSPCGTVGNPM